MNPSCTIKTAEILIGSGFGVDKVTFGGVISEVPPLATVVVLARVPRLPARQRSGEWEALPVSRRAVRFCGSRARQQVQAALIAVVEHAIARHQATRMPESSRHSIPTTT